MLSAGRLHCAGHVAVARRLAHAILAAGPSAGPSALSDILRGQDGHFALILETADRVVAAVDACRTQPIFYAATPSRTVVANDAYLAREAAGLGEWNAAAALEFAMAGFVTGSDTVVQGLQQLRAGELLVVKQGSRPTLQRYFTYTPDIGAQRSVEAWRTRLMDTLDAAVANSIERAAGRPIRVPISGGFDSRVVLCKLHEQGYRDLAAFSYGTPGNGDARAGRAVCDALGVPWRFVPSDGKRARQFFASQTRRDFWRFADGLCAIPNFQDLQALMDLRAADALPDDAVIANGQTGDFLSGGHIPKTLAEGTSDISPLIEALTAKHFALWQRLDTPANRRIIAGRMRDQLAGDRDETLNWPATAALSDVWEFDERQAKYVINGQRIYEFLGLDWELTLWDFGLVQLFRTVPLELKLGQRLYLDTLRGWDYRGLFAGHSRAATSWPRGARALLPVEAAVRRLLGPAAHRRFHRYSRYFGHYHHQYREMSLPVFLKLAGDARNLLSLHCRTWLEEAGVTPSPFDQTEQL